MLAFNKDYGPKSSESWKKTPEGRHDQIHITFRNDSTVWRMDGRPRSRCGWKAAV